ncbi:MAG TPA: AAC(3) family N-acetyltransferase [Acidimicrobiales bacterium]|nr:AAC(3) family N-acetyltransferase [Acidimicrobiales bacterium]
MGEEEVIHAGGPVTRARLAADLCDLGVVPGSTVMVHSSLSRLGWVAGGAQAVVLALLDAVGADGTLVVPTHSGHLSDPARWERPPVPEEWWPAIRRETPAFDPLLTPTRNMGAVVECFRHLPDASRSYHPIYSVAAVGAHRDRIVEGHALAHGLGEQSPLARLYDLDAWVLLLGVGHANNTSLHLAEYRADYPAKAWTTRASPVTVDGERRWVEWPDLDGDTTDFVALGADFAATGMEINGPVGGGTGRLMRQREVVDFAVAWMGSHRR